MILSPQAIEEFQDLHQLKFGYRPSREQAECDLLMLMEIIMHTQPVPRYDTEIK